MKININIEQIHNIIQQAKTNNLDHFTITELLISHDTSLTDEEKKQALALSIIHSDKEYKIVGVSFNDRQDLLQNIEQNTPICIEREPDNPYDPNAIAVKLLTGEQVGYIPKTLALKLANITDYINIKISNVFKNLADGALGGLRVKFTHKNMNDTIINRLEITNMLEQFPNNNENLNSLIKHFFSENIS